MWFKANVLFEQMLPNGADLRRILLTCVHARTKTYS